MSRTTEAEADADTCCANCGVAVAVAAEVDDIKLEECTDCDLVKYCSNNNCKEEHRELHEEECNIRKAELHDKKYLLNLMRHILGNVLSASCRCRLI